MLTVKYDHKSMDCSPFGQKQVFNEQKGDCCWLSTPQLINFLFSGLPLPVSPYVLEVNRRHYRLLINIKPLILKKSVLLLIESWLQSFC